MKVEVNENGVLQLEEVFNEIVIKTVDGVEFYICQRDYGIEVTCNGVTKYIDEQTFKNKEQRDYGIEAPRGDGAKYIDEETCLPKEK